LATVSDKKTGVDVNSNGIIDNGEIYNADVVTAQDYYPGGSVEPGRQYNNGSQYRSGFNGKENDNDIEGSNNALDFGGRIYDARINRWFSTDMHPKDYLSPYAFGRNDPVNIIDPDGNTEYHFHYLTVYSQVATPGPDGTLHTSYKPTTYTWVDIIQNNLENTFYVHKDIAKDNTKFTPSTPRQFFPDQSAGGAPATGITKTQFFGFFNLKDDDYTALLKILNDFPELEGIVARPQFRDPNAATTKTASDADYWYQVYRDKASRATAEKEEAQKNALMIGVLLTVFAPEEALPTAFEVFGEAGSIAGRSAAERYALGTTYKEFTNANSLITNNKTFDLFSLEKRQMVDVTTMDGNLDNLSGIYKKLNNLSDYKSSFFENRTLQVYVQDGKYTGEQISSLQTKLNNYIENNGLKVNVKIDKIK
jgi:RHS repeat-associated protein